MVRIVISNEQAEKVLASREAIEIVDEKGNRIGLFTQPFTDAEIAEARHRAETETGGRTTDQVLRGLSELDSQ